MSVLFHAWRGCMGLVLSAAVCGSAAAADAPSRGAKLSEKSAPDDPQAFWDPQAPDQKNKTGAYQVVCPGLPSQVWNKVTVPLGGVGPAPASTQLTHRVEAQEVAGQARLTPHPGEKVGYTVYAPRDIDPRESLGVLVYVAPNQTAPDKGIDHPFSACCNDRRLVCIAPTMAGNSALPGWRAACAVAAVDVARRRYAVDADRVFLCGLSGGGRITSYVMLRHPEIFRGASPIIGCNFPEPWIRGCGIPDEAIAGFCDNTRLAILEGSNDANQPEAKKAHDEWFKKRMRHVVYLEQPGLGHAMPSAAYRVQVLDFWDQERVAAAALRWAALKKDLGNPRNQGANLEELTKMRPAMHAKGWGSQALLAYQNLRAKLDAAVREAGKKIAAGDGKGREAAVAKLESEWGGIGAEAGKALRLKAPSGSAQPPR